MGRSKAQLIAGEHPVEWRVAAGLSDLADLVELELEAGLGEQVPVHLRRKAGEERGRAEKSPFQPWRVVVPSVVRKYPPRASHRGAVEHVREQFARHVVERGERRDRVERRRSELELREVGLDERRLGDVDPRAPICSAEMSTPVTAKRVDRALVSCRPAPQPSSSTSNRRRAADQRIRTPAGRRRRSGAATRRTRRRSRRRSRRRAVVRGSLTRPPP